MTSPRKADLVDEARVGDLYRAPLDRFTAERDRIAARLKADGQDEAAKTVKRLRKPTVAAWAVNQLAHRETKTLRTLLETIDRMREEGSPGELRALSQKRHSLTAKLRDRAAAILEEAGYGAGSSTLHLVTQTLYAGASEENRHLLEEGRLSRDLETTGFDTLGGALAEGNGDDEMLQVSSAARHKAEKLAAEAQTLANEASRLEEAARRKEEEAEAARRQATTAQRRALKAREKADKALDDLD